MEGENTGMSFSKRILKSICERDEYLQGAKIIWLDCFYPNRMTFGFATKQDKGEKMRLLVLSAALGVARSLPLEG